MPADDFLRILQILADHRVEFIVVGGVSAILNGAPVNTFDLDVVHSTAPKNVDRLLLALQEMDAHYRFQPELRLRPDSSHLSSRGHQLLMTKFGPADFLGGASRGRNYADLLPHTVEMQLGPALTVRVLDLETLILLKEEIGGEKDLAVLPILRRTLKEIQRNPGGGNSTI